MKLPMICLALALCLLEVAHAFMQHPGGMLTREMSSTQLYHTYSSKETAVAAIKASTIVVFSKTSCPFCKKAKEAIAEVTPLFTVVELDVIKDGAEQQAALLEITGQKTVPNVFVNGKHIGGCDDTLAAIASGGFKELIAA